MKNWFKKLVTTIGDMLTSKKFLGAATGAGIAIAAGQPVGAAIAGAAYALAQAHVDHAKEAAKAK